jgi:RNA polymerase sigma-70 factor (ECF subfamily)
LPCTGAFPEPNPAKGTSEIDHNSSELSAGERHLFTGDYFTEAIRPHIGRLLNIARGIVGSDDLAWDAVQEALLSLWKQGALPPNPRAWLIRAVTVRSLFLIRTAKRRRCHEQRAADLRSVTSDPVDPAHASERREFKEKLERAIAELSDEHRVVFVLYEIEGLEYEAIADVISVPVGTVRSRLSRARAALRDMLQRTMPEWIPVRAMEGSRE